MIQWQKYLHILYTSYAYLQTVIQGAVINNLKTKWLL